MKHKFKRNVVYVLARIVAAIFLFLPLRVAIFLGGRLGILLFFLIGKHRRQTLENLKSAFGSEKTQKEIYCIAKGVFENLGICAVEFISLPKINKQNIERFIEPLGIEKIDKLLEAKKGAIALTSHLGNWELEAAYFGLKGYPSNVVFRPSRDSRYDKIINSMRRSKNINIIPRENSFKKIVNLLKEGQLVGILPDQDIDSIDGVFVNFFGRPAYTPTGPVLLAMVSDVPIVPMFCVREGGHYKLIIEDPLELDITGNKERDVLVNTQKWSDLVEKYIRKYPSQWVWMHKRWKTKQKNVVQ